MKKKCLLFIFCVVYSFCANSQITPVNPNIQYAKPLVIPSRGTLNCSDLPAHYLSYEQALKLISSAHYKFSDKCSTPQSSWIREAEYYSCDKQTGFFLFKTDKQWYIHEGVPIAIWKGFKAANSHGSYYDHYIRKKYQLVPDN